MILNHVSRIGAKGRPRQLPSCLLGAGGSDAESPWSQHVIPVKHRRHTHTKFKGSDASRIRKFLASSVCKSNRHDYAQLGNSPRRSEELPTAVHHRQAALIEDSRNFSFTSAGNGYLSSGSLFFGLRLVREQSVLSLAQTSSTSSLTLESGL